MPSLVASSAKSLTTVGSGTMNGPVLLKVDNTTPSCLYLASPGTKPMMLTCGVVECPTVSSSDISLAGLDIGMPESDGHKSSIQFYSSMIILIMIVIALIDVENANNLKAEDMATHFQPHDQLHN